MDKLRATERNVLMGVLADALRKGKDGMNAPGRLPEGVPLLGGMGAGDLMLGQGPELVDDLSYGQKPYKGSGYSTKVDSRVLDLAAVPGVSGATSAALRGVKLLPEIAAASRSRFCKVNGR